MTGRILRIELRRSAAILTALLVAALGFVILYATTRAWGGRWMQLALAQREYVFMLVPLALGAGAWQAGRESRSKVGELFTSTARPSWRRVAPTVGVMAIGTAVGYVAMFGGGAVLMAGTATYFPLGAVAVVLVGALVMAAAVILGMAIGRVWPSSLTPPVLAIGGVVVMLTALAKVDSLTLQLLLGTARSDDFGAIATAVHVGQAVAALSLAATGFALLTVTGRRMRLAALAPALLGLVVAVAVLPATEQAATPLDARAASLVCTEDLPKVCVTKVHEPALADVRGPARTALRTIAAKLPDAPTEVRESTIGWSRSKEVVPPGTLLLDLYVDARLRVMGSQEELLEQMLDGAGTRQCPDLSQPLSERDLRNYAARTVVAAWLQDGKNVSDEPLVVKSLTVLRALPEAEQRAHVLAFRDAALKCDGRDLLDVLIPGGGQK